MGIDLNDRTDKMGIDITTIDNKSHEQNDDVLREAQKFLSKRYPVDKVLSYEDAKGVLADSRNKSYNWIVAKQEGKLVSLVVLDVWDVPKSPSRKELIPDGKNCYTSLCYAVASGKKYEPVLEAMLNQHLKPAKSIDSKTNVGMITDDLKHKDVLRALVEKYGGGSLGEIGVPTLKEIAEEEYETNFETNSYTEVAAIPHTKWTKSLALSVLASYLDEGYNSKGPGEEGYKPLTNAEYFQSFAESLNSRNPGRFVRFDEF